MPDATRDLVAGTRGSALALWQTRHVAALLRAQADVRTTQRVIVTEGDVNLADRLVGQIEKGFFTVELERELRAGTIDYAVHSLKDLPTRIDADLDLVAVLPRADAFDVLIARPDAIVAADSGAIGLAVGARVGTSSLRREALLKHYARQARCLPLRGNVPTRVDKLRQGHYDAIILAAAGVRRLGLSLAGFRVFELDARAWPPAPGQGCVAVQARNGDARTRALFAPLHDVNSANACERERSFLRVLEGGCTTPFGCYAHGTSVWMGRAGALSDAQPWWAAHHDVGPLDRLLSAQQIAPLLDRLLDPAHKDPAHDDVTPAIPPCREIANAV